jgi:hypothetical protein
MWRNGVAPSSQWGCGESQQEYKDESGRSAEFCALHEVYFE